MAFSQLDTPAGHIVCGFALMGIGGLFFKLGIPKAEDMIVAGFTIVGFASKGFNGRGMLLPSSNPDTKTTATVTSTSVTNPTTEHDKSAVTP